MDTQRWQLITLSPKVAASQRPEHLLPVDSLGVYVCQRADNAGQTQCEVVETEQSMPELMTYWTGQGWSVQPFFSNEPSDATCWICTKAHKSVQVRASREAQSLKTTLVFTAFDNL